MLFEHSQLSKPFPLQKKKRKRDGKSIMFAAKIKYPDRRWTFGKKGFMLPTIPSDSHNSGKVKAVTSNSWHIRSTVKSRQKWMNTCSQAA